MRITALTKGLPLQYVLSINFKQPGNYFIRAYDPDKSNTVYLSRNLAEVKVGVQEIFLALPISPPEKLVMDIKSNEGKPDNQAFEIQDISSRSLPRRNLFLSTKEIEFVKFAEWFCQNAGFIAVDNYQDANKDFTIRYMTRIVDDELGPIDTPARVDHYTGIIEVSQSMFRNYTIPMRMFIIMHERMHYVLDSTQEEKADVNALNICLALGYPKIELLYAATKIFQDSPENERRVSLIEQYIANFS